MSDSQDERIQVSRPAEQMLDGMGVSKWPIWTKEESTFDWEYDQNESCYILEGTIVVATDRTQVVIGVGDFVTFQKGLRCTWTVKRLVRKHYRFH